MWWILFGVLVVIAVAVAAYVWFARTVGSTPAFIASYNLIYDRTQSVAEALKQAIENFRFRAPFNVLSDADVDYLVDVFSKHSDPLVLARLFHHADKRGDATPLKDRDWIARFADESENIATKR